MKQERLAYELANFCLAHKIFNVSCEVEEFAERLVKRFNDVTFVETLINHITVKTQHNDSVDKSKLIELLNALDLIKLQLEYYGEPEREKTR